MESISGASFAVSWRGFCAEAIPPQQQYSTRSQSAEKLAVHGVSFNFVQATGGPRGGAGITDAGMPKHAGLETGGQFLPVTLPLSHAQSQRLELPIPPPSLYSG